MTFQDQIEAAQLETTHNYVKVSEHREQEALFAASTANRNFRRAEVELKTSEIYQQRARNANRPSILLGAAITTEQTLDGRTIYIASASGVTAHGESPELAFQEFDRMWTQGGEE